MSSLFGGGSTPQVQYTPKGFSNPTGFSVGPGGNITESPTLQSNMQGLQSTFGQQAAALGGLAQTVKPGFSQFRQAGLTDIANQFMAGRSNLKDTLAQRRVLGSSFGNSQFNQLDATEAQTKADFEAQSYLQELNASFQLTQAQYQAATQQFSSAINQSNIEAQTAAQMMANINSTSASIAETNAQLQAQSQAGAGKFFGTLLGAGASLALAPFTGGASLMAMPGILAGTGGGGGGITQTAGLSSGLHMDSGGLYFGA